jgi:predicted nucleic acid-binding Zn ribbon protein
MSERPKKSATPLTEAEKALVYERVSGTECWSEVINVRHSTVEEMAAQLASCIDCGEAHTVFESAPIQQLAATSNHTAKAGVAGRYNRAGYLPERKSALERWAQHVQGKPGNVVDMPSKKRKRP